MAEEYEGGHQKFWSRGLVRCVPQILAEKYFAPNFHTTVCLASIGNPVPENQEFCLAPSETMVEQVKK
jgi:hypothetical protein